ncbi:hypothetical protein [Devosia faecipullorum]|uniref:hypothetical protein n=1 Tax=Devosia faecipullorum TaxID=2755039 RepID=UPI00187B5A49|nr:hypothetical protein [Devosia faecipullorum]MBE7734426.1 hypothetical protein [Devosia faecipullorum]
MDQENVVQDVSVEIDGQIHTASYFVENGTIHANLGNQTYLLPIGPVPANEAVKSLIAGTLRRRGFRATLARKWFSHDVK